MSKTKTSKKVTKKAVTKRAPKKSPEQIEMEKFQKKQEAFTAKMKIVSAELDAISKKHGIKLLAQGYDIKTQSEFTIGSGISGHIDSVAMGEMAKRTFA